MPARTIVAPPQAIDFDAIRGELGIPDGYPPDAVAQARESAAERRPASGPLDVPFVTLDPPGSRDLDQAVHLSRQGDGYLVRYAIADVAGFVDPTGPLAQETWRRGATLYSPDRSHAAASDRVVRGCGEPAARGAAAGRRLDDRVGRGRRTEVGGRPAGERAVRRPARLSVRPGRRRRRAPAPVDRAAAGDRRAAADAGPRPWGDQPGHPGHRGGAGAGRPVDAGAAGGPAGPRPAT